MFIPITWLDFHIHSHKYYGSDGKYNEERVYERNNDTTTTKCTHIQIDEMIQLKNKKKTAQAKRCEKKSPYLLGWNSIVITLL